MTTQEPFSYKNWVNSLKSSEPLEIHEYPLFTDAYIISEVIGGLGPYKLLNPVRIGQSSRPSIVLRVEWHPPFENLPLPLTATNDSMYHGGDLPDEIAALVALCLGIRIKAGGEIRRFIVGNDPLGHPVSSVVRPDPVLPVLVDAIHKEPIPSLQAQHRLDEAKRLLDLIEIKPKDAVALVRAARLYQEAVWISSTTPELSWLMLTSAVEVVANRWRENSETPIERLRASRPELEQLLLTKGDEEFVNEVAKSIAPYMGATKKFLDFLLEFLPPAPEKRPEWAQLSWETKNMKKALGKVYAYRSKALHGGIPFPYPMSHPGMAIGDSNILAEIPSGLAAGSLGGSWVAQDMPMLLHTYEYIARNAVLNWWEKAALDNK